MMAVGTVLILALLQEPAEPPRGRPATQEQLKARLQELDAKIKESPKEAELFLQRSDVRRRMGDGKGADEDHAKAIELNPELRNRPQRPQRPPVPGGQRPPNPPFGDRAPRPSGEGEFRPPMREEEVRAYLEECEPETLKRLARAKEEGRPEEAERVLFEAQGRAASAREMKEHDPKGWEKMKVLRAKEQESLELAEKARQAPPEQRERANAALAKTLGELFDLREENRAREVEELKRRLAGLEKALSDRKAAKDRIVESRRRELLGERRDDEW